jgi:signal transduction histidine kinase
LWRQQGLRRQRAEELLRLGQVARLDSLGELAAGMAHELNQPLTAVLASTQAALRVLADDPPDLDLSRQALQHAVAQAGRASEVLKRLRRLVERPGGRAQLQPVDLHQAVADTLQLLAPEAAARQVDMSLAALPSAPTIDPAPAATPAGLPIADAASTASSVSTTTPRVLADPVALQQVLHNLVMNALQALEHVPASERRLQLRVGRSAATRGLPAGAGIVEVADHGPGIAAHDLPRLFEPFYTTRPGGLGLGLSLCDTLVTAMGGQLSAANAATRGAVFTLALPLARPDDRAPARAESTAP